MQQQLRSPFPPPPPYYKKYTRENVETLAAWKNEIISERDATEMLGATPAEMEPPTPPRDDEDYFIFGQKWSSKMSLPSLEESGCQQLYKGTSFDPREELSRLNRSALVTFLDLIQRLVEKPSQADQLVDHLRIILINMHHIINEYRPHQVCGVFFYTLHPTSNEEYCSGQRNNEKHFKTANSTGS